MPHFHKSGFGTELQSEIHTSPTTYSPSIILDLPLHFSFFKVSLCYISQRSFLHFSSSAWFNSEGAKIYVWRKDLEAL